MSKPPTDKSIAVLPFANLSGKDEMEFFSDGITEEIINALAQINQLKVTSRTSSFYFKGKNLPIQKIATELNVSSILEGSVRVAANTVRITAQLIEASEDFHFWSETWDRELSNIFEIQDEISLLIAEKLREQFGHFEIKDHLIEKDSEDLDAFECVLKARFHLNKWNPQDVNTAIEWFEKAIILAPKHTDAYVGLADAYSFLAVTQLMPYKEAWAKTIANLDIGQTLNPEHAGVHYQIANVAYFYEANFQKALKHAQKAVALKANYAEAQQLMAFLYMNLEQYERANIHLDTAYKIDPLSQETLFYRAYFAYRTKKYNTALELYEQCLASNPHNIPAYISIIQCLLKLGRFQQALDKVQNMPTEITIPDEQLGLLCLTHILMSNEPEASKQLKKLQLQAKNSTSHQAHSYLFLAYANLNKNDAAFNWLDTTIGQKSPVLFLTFTDPLADNLQDDARRAVYKTNLYKLDQIPEDTKPSKPPLLDPAMAKSMKENLMQFISSEKPFLISNLSLRSLAEQVEIHPNKLSWLLNEQLGKNFNEFINHFRIQYFKNLATDPSNSHISLLGLAYESGFNSKTVFNTYFKKETGLTPKEFIQQQP